MAHSISAKKRIRQAERRNERNRARRSRLRNELRDCRDVLSAGKPADAEQAVRDAIRLLDREATRGLIHANQAARRKSRLAKKLNALKKA